MDLEHIMLNEISQTEKNKNRDFTHMWDMEQKATNELTKQTNKEISQTHRQQFDGCQRGKEVGGGWRG